MKIRWICLLVAVSVGLLGGCEWKGGSAADTWDSSNNAGDFSAVYRASDNGVLVRSNVITTNATTNVTYTTTTNSVITTNTVQNEQEGLANGVDTVLAGYTPFVIIKGSLSITVAGYTFTDTTGGNAAGNVALNVNPSDGSSGTYNYNNRQWILRFLTPPVNGVPIMANYTYAVTTSSTTDTPVGTNVVVNGINTQGNHGDAIFSFVIFQQGNKIEITDSSGNTFSGTIGSFRNSGGQPAADGSNLANGAVEAQFTATGYANGYYVQIIGILKGTMATTSMNNRSIQATYIEQGGYVADITGLAN